MIAFVALTKFTSSRKGTKRNGELYKGSNLLHFTYHRLLRIFILYRHVCERVCAGARVCGAC